MKRVGLAGRLRVHGKSCTLIPLFTLLLALRYLSRLVTTMRRRCAFARSRRVAPSTRAVAAVSTLAGALRAQNVCAEVVRPDVKISKPVLCGLAYPR